MVARAGMQEMPQIFGDLTFCLIQFFLRLFSFDLSFPLSANDTKT